MPHSWQPTLYLAGSIRDGVPEDIAWREELITALNGLAIILNPLAGKQYDATSRLWTIHGIPSTGRLIVKQDLWCVDHADMGIFNFLSLAQGYPTIGTLCEFGRMTKTGALMYAIVPQDYVGHENTATFAGLHPFLTENCVTVFPSVAACASFVRGQLVALSGANAHFQGVIGG